MNYCVRNRKKTIDTIEQTVTNNNYAVTIILSAAAHVFTSIIQFLFRRTKDMITIPLFLIHTYTRQEKSVCIIFAMHFQHSLVL